MNTNWIDKLRREATGADYDFVQTSPCGGGQRHLHGYVRNIFRVNNPDSITIGHCFMRGRLKKGDYVVCIGHSGDCFQEYAMLRVYGNAIQLEQTGGNEAVYFGSYGMGDSSKLGELKKEDFFLLLSKRLVHFKDASYIKDIINADISSSSVV